jgi:hypothetical protein
LRHTLLDTPCRNFRVPKLGRGESYERPDGSKEASDAIHTNTAWNFRALPCAASKELTPIAAVVPLNFETRSHNPRIFKRHLAHDGLFVLHAIIA